MNEPAPHGATSSAASDAELLAILSELGREVTAVLDLDQLLERIPNLISRLTSFTVFSVYLLDEHREELSIAYALGYPEEIVKHFTLKLGQGTVGTAVAEQRPVLLNDVSTDPRYLAVVPGARSQLAVPLRHKGKAIGANSKWAGGKMDMSVTCMVGDKAMSVAVDGAGKAGKSEDAKGVTGGGDVVKYMDAAKLTMTKVLEAAEAHSKGKALAVTAKAAAGKASYEVYCLAGDKLQNVKVDDTGKATGMAEAKELPANEEKPKPKPGG